MPDAPGLDWRVCTTNADSRATPRRDSRLQAGQTDGECEGARGDGIDGLGFDVTPGEQAGGAAAAWFAARVRTLRLRVGETSTKMIEVNCDAR